MRTGTVILVVAGVVVVAGVLYSFIRMKDAPVGTEPALAARSGPASKFVHVDDLARSPGGFTGEIVLRAAVVGVNRSEGVFGVIDSREFESCGSLSCAENTLPVKFGGKLPPPRAVVEITGRVVRDERGLVIDARLVEAVP